MDVERYLVDNILLVEVLRLNAQCQTLIIEALSSLHFYHFLYHCSWEQSHVDRSERRTITEYLSTIGIRAVLQVESVEFQRTADGLGLFALVGQEDREAGGFVVVDTADALLVELDLRVLNFLGALVEHGAGVIEHGSAFVLPRLGGSTATGAVDETRGVVQGRRVVGLS